MAPRARANSSSSRTSVAAPSASTKPSRSASNGREARSGVSLYFVDSAREAWKAARPMRVTQASAPPLIMATASPRRIASRAVPTASAPEAQAETGL